MMKPSRQWAASAAIVLCVAASLGVAGAASAANTNPGVVQRAQERPPALSGGCLDRDPPSSYRFERSAARVPAALTLKEPGWQRRRRSRATPSGT